jgi:hypothetical protein
MSRSIDCEQLQYDMQWWESSVRNMIKSYRLREDLEYGLLDNISTRIFKMMYAIATGTDSATVYSTHRAAIIKLCEGARNA